MKISYNWLKNYIRTNKSPSELAEILTGIGLEVEAVNEWESVRGSLEGVVTGMVVECKPHPNADTLFVTRVDTGSGDLLSIVCGAHNVAAGQVVPVATAGTTLYPGDRELTLKRTKIRGEVSEGMICAEDELGIGDDHSGIVVLPPETPVGIPVSGIFSIEKDVVFEIGLTPNRIDSGSHFGVARDLAAWLSQTEKISAILPHRGEFRVDNNNLNIPVTIENRPDCPRYSALTISNINVGESPQWLRNKLKAIGLNPVNNIVDATNYILHEIGQPLHAFDADKIKGGRVIVKNMPEGSSFTTLDGIERKLSARDLMICNESEAMCIAGVFGGIGSGITTETKNIFLESAYFNPVSIRKTARRHDLSTDASFRFERGADPEITITALKRAALLIKELAGGEISSEIIDNYPEPILPVTVTADISRIEMIAGKKLGEEIIISILESLDIKTVSSANGILELLIPLYRVDVNREADIIEEILRIYGYDNIQTGNRLISTLSYIRQPDRERIMNTIADMLSGAGFNEIVSNSLNPGLWYEESPDFDNSTLVKISNPLSSDLNVMRQSLLYGGLSAMSRNINRQNGDLRLYEFGHCYFRKKSDEPTRADDPATLFSEETSLSLFVTGAKRKASWNHKEEISDFWYLRSVVEMILSRAGISLRDIETDNCSKAFMAEGVDLSMGNRVIARYGRISRQYLEKADIRQDAWFAHIEWDWLVKRAAKQAVTYSELPKYPSVRRDLALLVDRDVKFGTIRDLAFKNEKVLLRDVSLFDVYESESLGKNKKSYAVSFLLRDDRKTLTDKAIDKTINNLARVFESELNAKIR
ncbi:MAG: phenylalanine--tRNA ligase subunit beta [Bacteroidales bacterium]|nr:phenylalanine--tRNA ligase subunit beta [Bacteroidales bacterium]